jgi:hypothetical protein
LKDGVSFFADNGIERSFFAKNKIFDGRLSKADRHSPGSLCLLGGGKFSDFGFHKLWESLNVRILQGEVSTSWVSRSDDPARSLHAFVAGFGGMTDLLDDQGITTKIKALEVVAPDEKKGIVFAAKDYETLIRGFKYLADNGKTKGKREFYLKESSSQNLAAMSIIWQEQQSRHTNKASAAIVTAGYNVKQFLSRAVVRTGITIAPGSKNFWQNTGMIDRYQSISDNMESAGRDGKMVHRGAALYICSGAQMPTNMKWGRTWRQIDDTLTFGMLATVATKLFSG